MKREAFEAGIEAAAAIDAPSDDAEGDATRALLESVIEASNERAAPARIDGVVVARLCSIDPLAITVAGDADARPARAMAAIVAAHLGREVAVLFENGDASRPVIIGVMEPRALQPGVDVAGDGTVTITAPERIVLRCGEASLTLTKEGKVLLSGAHVSSRSTGVVRIVGASVEIN